MESTMPPSTSHATVDHDDGVLTVTFTRQGKLNAISPEMTETLWGAVRAVRDDPALRVLVITAVGRYFTAGIDLAAPMPATVAVSGSDFRRRYREHHLLYDEIEALEKPVVLAAQGPCLGAGLEMACSCDFRFASDATTFCLPEVAMGTIAGSGGVSRLTGLVGPHWSKWLAMANQTIDARRALSIGLVHDVFATEDFQERVQSFVRSLVALPPEAVAASKLAIGLVTQVDRTTARDIERLANTNLVFGQEFRELGSPRRDNQA